jgi:hypothetical protein
MITCLYSNLLIVSSLDLADDLQAGICSQLTLLTLALPLVGCLDYTGDIL